MAVANNTTCLFLDALPTELRLSIYEYLLITDAPLQGRNARNGKHLGVNLSILRINRQIHEEAKTVFYGKNTFLVTSIPSDERSVPEGAPRQAEEETEEQVVGRFDPPLQSHHLPLIRHLALDLLYLPSVPVFEAGLASWRTADTDTAAYVNSLVHLLTSTTPKTLHLTARPPRPFDAKACLLSFSAVDRNRAFAAAIYCLDALKTLSLSFEFPDCYYRTTLSPGALHDQSILLLASQVMFCQSQVRIQQMMREFEGGAGGVGVLGVHGDVVMRKGGEVEEEGCGERVDLDSLVRAWPGQVSELVRVVGMAKEVERAASQGERCLERLY